MKIKFNENSDVIFTTYFTSKRNPQANNFAPSNNISYIYTWYASIVTLGLNGVIIHDGLSDEFIKNYSRDNIVFYYYNPKKYSLNDERYFALNEILTDNKFNKVLLTDGSDLIIKKNPFEFFTDENLLYFGTDIDAAPSIKDNAWCLNKLQSLLSTKPNLVQIEMSFLDFNYINAGVYGGSYNLVREFNLLLVNFMLELNSSSNNNMMAINYLLWKAKLDFFKGPPLTSPFKQYELHGDYIIIHK